MVNPVLETKKNRQRPEKEEVFKWLRRIARENPEIFGRGGAWRITALREHQTSSHINGAYMIDGIRIHVKYFRQTLGRTGPTYDPRKEMEAEYSSLIEYERRGFSSGRYQVIRALGINNEIDCALATLYADGDSLQSLIIDTIEGNRSPADLYMGLELTAGILKRIHTCMPQSYTIDTCEMFYSYMKSLLHLEELNALNGNHRRVMRNVARWHDYRPLFEQRGATIHGDANPSNFKVKTGIVYALDVERSRPRRSPCTDLGCIAADLWHQFAREAKDGSIAKPFIDHFLRAYEPDNKKRKEIEAIIPFYTSQSMLKIATLGYWDRDYRQLLVSEAVRHAGETPDKPTDEPQNTR